jgi:hypothetical protein
MPTKLTGAIENLVRSPKIRGVGSEGDYMQGVTGEYTMSIGSAPNHNQDYSVSFF